MQVAGFEQDTPVEELMSDLNNVLGHTYTPLSPAKYAREESLSEEIFDIEISNATSEAMSSSQLQQQRYQHQKPE